MTIALATVRYYTQLDPYFYTVDNRPLQDLASSDDQLNAELDRRTLCVDITGSATPTVNQVPAGWTVAVNGTGDYTITHNLGYTNYVANISVVSTTGGFANIYSFDANTIRVVTRTTGGVAVHSRFHLRVIGY